jgi:hypothetical protein
VLNSTHLRRARPRTSYLYNRRAPHAFSEDNALTRLSSSGLGPMWSAYTAFIHAERAQPGPAADAPWLTHRPSIRPMTDCAWNGKATSQAPYTLPLQTERGVWNEYTRGVVARQACHNVAHQVVAPHA